MCRLCAALAALPVIVGCAGGNAAPDWRQRARFGVAEDLPRIAVYGNLAGFVPRFNPTPALDEFLYGPTEPPGLMLRNPQGLVMLNGRLLVCDQGYPEIIGVDLATGRSASWADVDHRPRCPVAIAVGDNGMVYVADTTLRGVLVYLPTGGFVEQLTPGAGPDAQFRPCSLAIGKGVLHIGNLAGRRIDRWNTVSREWMPPIAPPASAPPAAPTGLAFTTDGTLLIADAVQGRVLRVASDGQWLAPIGAPGRLEGQFVRPKHVACTPSGLIVVTDAGRQSVLVFDAAGAYIAEVCEQAKGWTGFTLPAGVIALPADGLAMLMPEGRPAPDPRPDEWIIVSDTLGAASLNLMGVMLPHRGGVTDAAR